MKDEIKEMNLSEMLFNRDERLLDCITNLREENERLKKENTKLYKKDTKIISKLKEELEITQEKWDKDKQFYICRTKEWLDYKSRNEKAIEYIRTHYLKPTEPELENILQGSDKE